jgi:antitoxin (DNA-binding transcriptional repressor) of toxin-antitoxin stability system
MTATLEQAQSNLLKLVNLAHHGEEIVITCPGQPVAMLTGVPPCATAPNRQAWLARLSELRGQLSLGKAGPTIKQILDEDRGD